ncbi:MAG: hydroxyisourate hydrolase [Proteobacteria bacterium]|nr:hydroxyisourate hydrolase [Pseudomonadota bacterium]
MGRITTHVLDTAQGIPAKALPLSLWRIAPDVDANGEQRQLLVQTQTNTDGRCDQPLLTGEDFAAGVYELVFDAATYLTAQGLPTDFLTLITIRFSVSAGGHYHVPLLLSPFAYSTYRGS